MPFPKSLRYYQAPTKDQNPHHLNEAMQNHQFTPCGAMDWFTQGFVPPVPGQEHLAYHMHGTILVALRRQEKRIPAGVIRDKVDAMVKEIEARDVRRVGRKEKQQLRERVTDELLPSTQPTSWTIRAWIDLARNRVMIEASSAAKAELMITMLRTAMPPYPARLPRPLLSPATQMTQDILIITTGVVFLKLKKDQDITIDDVTTLQVINNGFVPVFINDLELASKERLTIVVSDGSTSKVELSVRFATTDTNVSKEFSKFSWNKKELDIVYKKIIRCRN
jgi:recombination associated protein RdgC